MLLNNPPGGKNRISKNVAYLLHARVALYLSLIHIYLSSNEIKDVLNNQDFIYKGDLKKWGKLANSLKLKIASRLINKDRNRAFEIVKQVDVYKRQLVVPFTTTDAPMTVSPVAALTMPVHVPLCCVIFTSVTPGLATA